MKRWIIILLVVAAVATTLAQDLAIRFQNAPLDMVLDRYSNWTGKKVEIVRGVNAQITFQTEKSVTYEEAVVLIEQELQKQNIGLFAITSNRLVASWIDLTKTTVTNTRSLYQELLEQRRKSLRKREVIQQPEWETTERSSSNATSKASHP